ncbi:hypothetical protein BDB01DRAFT_484094 [Pilobolus umbonatus]|nr:hypothetical protein BDB01DRAFT_484094 [Pilobolus umbonatus]
MYYFIQDMSLFIYTFLHRFFHQAVHDISSNLVELSTSKPYNRPLEAEADFVGLMIMAKAGYDPRVAIDVWQILARLDGKDENDDDDDETVVEESTVEEAKKFELLEYMDQLQSKWFGSTHPPSKERMVHMRENMEAALRLYEDTLKINGPVIKPVIVEEEPEPEISTLQQIARLFYRGA